MHNRLTVNCVRCSEKWARDKTVLNAKCSGAQDRGDSGMLLWIAAIARPCGRVSVGEGR